MTRRHLRLAVLTAIAFAASPAHETFAQVAVDLGAQVGVGCTVDCDPCNGVLVGGYGGVRIGEHFGIRARYSVFEPDSSSDPLRTGDGPAGEALIITYGRKRQRLVAEPVYRFRPDKRVRPFVGASIGIRIDQVAKRCEPISCEEVTAVFGQEVGSARHSTLYSGGVISGLSLQPRPWLTVEAMLGVHDWPGENGRATTEFAIMVGVIPWRSSQGP